MAGLDPVIAWYREQLSLRFALMCPGKTIGAPKPSLAGASEAVQGPVYIRSGTHKRRSPIEKAIIPPCLAKVFGPGLSSC